MRPSRVMEEQVIGILQEGAAGGSTGELCRRHGISRDAFNRWIRYRGEERLTVERPRSRP